MAVNLSGLNTSFFDSAEVLRMVDKKTIAALSKFGAFVRQRAKSSIKYKKTGISEPGKPPFAHKSSGFTRQKTNKKTGKTTTQSLSPLRELLFFAYDRSSKTVVVGPVPFRGKSTAPGLLERGGTGIVQRSGRRKKAKFRARPFMRPAMLAEAPKFASFFRG